MLLLKKESSVYRDEIEFYKLVREKETKTD